MNQDPKSFALYTGKAPVIVQLVAGLLWLGAIALLLLGIVSLIVNIVAALGYLVVAAFLAIVWFSLFKMKKNAFIYSIILGVVLIAGSLYSAGTVSSSAITPAILIVIAFVYKNRFVN